MEETLSSLVAFADGPDDADHEEGDGKRVKRWRMPSEPYQIKQEEDGWFVDGPAAAPAVEVLLSRVVRLYALGRWAEVVAEGNAMVRDARMSPIQAKELRDTLERAERRLHSSSDQQRV